MMHQELSAAFRALGELAGARVRELESHTPPLPLEKRVNAAAFDVLRKPAAGVTLDDGEVIALATALASHLDPHLFDEAIAAALEHPANHPRIGGIRGKDSRLFLPTVETVMFLTGVTDIAGRMAVMHWFADDHAFTRKRLLLLGERPPEESIYAARLVPGEDLVGPLIGVPTRRPRLGPEFPAQRIDTRLQWDDLVLDPQTLREVREIEAWIRHGETLLGEWGMGKYLKPGYRGLFFGPSGTGKTLTASLLGKQTGRDVYRIDLSQIVSKYIGETEKNLARIFNRAEDMHWILFFDEADALFGKRTGVRDAHDRYANQEVSYLLQRVETFSGLVILASNLRNNLDEAFLRRFQSVIHFPKPTPEERLRIWKRMLPERASLPEDFNLPALCKRHELTGANIASIIQYASLQAMERGETLLAARDIDLAISREHEKEGRLG
jgi:hypothetical protein